MHNVYDTDVFTAWPLIEFLTTWWLQASILLAIGLLTAFALRRPVYQATVFRACMVAVLLCPALALAVQWTDVAMLTLDLRQRFVLAEPTESLASTDVAIANRREPSYSAAMRTANLAPADSSFARPDELQPPIRTEAPSQPPSTLAVDDLSKSSVAKPALALQPALPHELLYLWLIFGAWAIGTILLLIHLACDLRYARWLVKRSAPADAVRSECCQQLAARFGTRSPTILITPLMSSPCLIGQLHPVILLPEETQVSHCPRVFMHELAHLKRGDWAWSLVGRIACALLWFHPLVWWLHRSHLSVAEDICDDYVIQLDGNREDYLQQLIEIAEHSLPTTVAAGLSIVGFHSKLGKRAQRILDTTRTLSTHVSPRFLAAALVAALVSVISVAMLEVGQSRAATAANESLAEANETSQTQEASPAQADSSTSDRRDDTERTHTGKVVDAQGRPIAGAQVAAINDNGGVNHRKKKVLAQTNTDRDGSYSLTFKPEDGDNRVRVTAQGYGENFVGFTELHELFTKGQSKLDLQLGKEEPIIGRIVDTEGRPVPNVKLQVIHLMLPTSSDAVAKWSSQSPSELLKSGDFMMWNDPRITATMFPTRLTEDYATGKATDKAPTVQTDKDGRFRIDGYSADSLLHVRLTDPAIAVQEVQLVARKMPVVHAFGHWVRSADYRHYGNDATLVVSPTQLIRGRVIAAESQMPLVGVPVVVTRLGDSVWMDDAAQAVTNQDGQFELTGAPLGGGHVVEVRPAVDLPYFTTHIELPKANEPTPLVCNFQLTKCKWIRGRVTDEQGKGVVAKLNLHPFRDNEYATKYPNFDPKITGQTPDFGTLTNERGEFRIKAIPGHSLLTAFCADYKVSPLYFSNRPEGLLEKVGGEQMPAVMNAFSADFFDAIVEVELNESEEEIAQDLVFKKGIERVLKLVDESGRPLEAIDIFGQTWMRALQPNAKLENSSIKLAGLGPEESRVVVVMTADGRSGKHLNISGQESSVIETQLERCSSIRGRVVNSEGEPVKDLNVEVSVQNSIAPDTWARKLRPMTTNDRGEFSTRLPPGGTYTISAYSSAGPNFYVQIKPTVGDDYDLGDLTAGVERIVEDKP